MPVWLNHVTVLTAAAGSHTVDPSNPTASGGVVKDGAAFSPTAGRFLVCVVAGPVTSTTPTGWTLPAGGSQVSTDGLYVFYKTAAGSDTVSTTHNSSAYQVTFDFYEFASSASFGAVAHGNINSGLGMTLSGLTGSSFTLTPVVSPNNGALTYSFTGATKQVEYDTGTSGAHHYALGYTSSTASSVTVSATGATHEQVMFAMYGTSSPSANVNAPAATATAAASAPAVTSDGAVTAPAATASAAALAPSVTAPGDAAVIAPAASATASALPPTVAADSTLAVTAATASAAALAPTVSLSATIAAPVADSSASAAAPFVDNGSGSQTVAPPAASATADAPAPLVLQIIETSTDTSNNRHGRRRLAYATATVTRPVAAPPDTLTLATKVDKAVAYPAPTMVNGRPT